MENGSKNVFECWAILELMGHRKIAGKVQEVEVFGGKMCRIDIPAGEPDRPAITQLYGQSSIYALTVTDEETARAFALARRETPIEEWSARRMLEPRVEDKSQTEIVFAGGDRGYAGVDDEYEDLDGGP